MALKNSRRYQGEISRNAGIFKVDQVELVGQSSAPSDSDLANSRFYLDSDDGQVWVRVSAQWNPVANGFQKITAITATTTLTDAHAGVLIVNTSSSITLTLPSAATDNGLTFTFVNRNAQPTTLKATSNEGIDTNSAVGTIYGDQNMDAAGDMLTLVADGSGTWYITSRYIH